MEKGMTQKQLAKAIGVSEKYIDEVEAGKRVLSDDLLKKVSKALQKEISDVMLIDVEENAKPIKAVREPVKQVKHEVQEIWSNAFDSVLKTVPVYDYGMEKVLDTRQLPIVSNKVEGFNKDKVVFLEIQDNDMVGFRMVKGDMAFAHLTQEVENNATCLVEVGGKRVIRQLKKLEGDKVLLVSNNGRLVTETVAIKDLKVIAKLIKLEIKLI